MDNTQQLIRTVCIAGGGTAGWIAAALCSHYLSRELKIILIESEEIGTIGVGESTIPPFLQLLARLEISESEFIRETQASFKLGIKFMDWLDLGESYFHPFGTIGLPGAKHDPYQLWLQANAAGSELALQSLAPASAMAAQGRMMLPFMARQTPIGGAAYSLHVDARRVTKFLRNFAEQRGVQRREGMIEAVEASGGEVQALRLRGGDRIEADFFIDCTGFRSLLLGEALDSPFEDWSDYLLCDRAVVVQTENVQPPPPFTLSAAQQAGWRWRIPLQHRTGNGHVFSSRHMSDDEARAILVSQVEGPLLTEPALLKFRTGVRPRMWTGNVAAVGLAAGFVEPLESTAIHLVYRAMDFLFRYFPQTRRAEANAAEFNRRMVADYAEIRDFLVAHYCLSRRRDTPFWRDVAAAPVPPELTHRLALFSDMGAVPELVDGMFGPVSWQSVLEGMAVHPRRAHPFVAGSDGVRLGKELTEAAEMLGKFVATLPTHQQFIEEHCQAPGPAAIRVAGAG